ncbi:MAG TPA: DUF4139 domain-containing protein [Luteibaculaceae bacterium]|nr:DUF4139 domain-containing protein [Luteibaculaceae bacterium]
MKGLIAFSVLLLAVTSQAQDALLVNHSIKKATVFQNTAELTHKGTVGLKPGVNNVVFRNITPFIDPGSVRVGSDQEVTVTGVNIKPVFVDENDLPENIKKLKGQLKDAEFNLQIRKSYKAVYTEEKDLLLKNKTVIGGDSKLTPDDLIDVANLYRTRLKEIEVKILEINEEEKKFEEEVNRLKAIYNEVSNGLMDRRSEVELTLFAKQASNVTLSLNYLTSNAGWAPSYEARSTEGQSSLTWITKANVFQNTGVEWREVQLSLSSGNPSNSMGQPTLFPEYVDYNRPLKPVMLKMKSSAEMAYASESQTVDEVMLSGPDVMISEGLVGVYFDISTPYTIPSLQRPTSVEIERADLAADYVYAVVPKLQREVHLIANIKEGQAKAALPGEVNVYHNNNFVGKSMVDPSANGPLELSMGTESGILVKRTDLNQFSKDAGLIGGNKKSFKYKFAVKNNRSKAITLRLEDQIPLSRNADIVVEPENLSGGTLTPETGKVLWQITLQPGESKEWEFLYSVKYPKGTNINR